MMIRFGLLEEKEREGRNMSRHGIWLRQFGGVHCSRAGPNRRRG